MRIATVIPNQASAWLEPNINRNNRNLSRPLVASYANEMREGRWVVGSPIMFNAKGELIDGQHRLAAIVEYGKGVPFAIMENVPDSAREVIDQGRGRNVSDLLRMIYGQNRSSLVTGAIRSLDQFIHDYKFKLSVGHALEMIERYKGGIDWAVENVPGRTLYTSSPIVGSMIYAHKTAPASVDMFARRFFVGDSLPATSPILVVRNQLQRMGILLYRDQKREAFMIVLHAIYKAMRNESMSSKSIRVREDMLGHFAVAYERQGKKSAAA